MSTSGSLLVVLSTDGATELSGFELNVITQVSEYQKPAISQKWTQHLHFYIFIDLKYETQMTFIMVNKQTSIFLCHVLFMGMIQY